MRHVRTGASFLAVLLLLTGCESCLKRVPAESVETLPYPTCDDDAGAPEVLAEGHLRAGPTSPEKDVVERFRLERRGCHHVMTVRQEWAGQLDDVEVVYDGDMRPLRVWKRMESASPRGRDPVVDIRRYELRTDPVTVTIRNAEGLSRYWFRGERPIAVVGPGRGALTAWIRAAQLDVGESVRGAVLDFRRPVERVETVALRRDPDRFERTLGRTVRVYTVFGRESVFADENDVVIGDLAGLRPSDALSTPEPPARPSRTPPDPVNTP